MKKLLILSAILLSSFMLTACSNSESIKTDERNIENATSTPSPITEIKYGYTNNYNQFISEDDDFIYVADYVDVKKISKTTGETAVVYTDEKFFLNFELFQDRFYLVTGTDLISTSLDGSAVKKVSILDENSQFIADSFFIMNDILYIESYASGNIYEINPTDLTLTQIDANLNVSNTYINSRGMQYTYNGFESGGNLIYISENNEEVSINENDNSVIDTTLIFNDNYIFYLSSKDSSNINLYRTSLLGEDKTSVTSFNKQSYTEVKHDDNFVYIITDSVPSLKIDMNTLETINLTPPDIQYPRVSEVSNEKIFYLFIEDAFYIDTNSMSIVELD